MTEIFSHTRQVVIFAFLLIIGTMQLLGDISNQPYVKGFGFAINASPAPKVFTANNGFETYANRFFLKYTTTDGVINELEITPRLYQRLKGPYNRRNVYGAVSSYGPVLVRNPATLPMFNSIFSYAFCPSSPIYKDMEISDIDNRYPISIALRPLGGNKDDTQWRLNLEAQCFE